MKIIRTLKRIEMLEKALVRANAYIDRNPCTTRDIDFEISDKLDELRTSLEEWKRTGNRETDRIRRKQLKLAKRYIG